MMCNLQKRLIRAAFWLLLQGMFMSDWKQTAQRLKLQKRLLTINKRKIIRWNIYRDNNFHSRRQVFNCLWKSLFIFIYLFIYLFNRFHLDTILKKTREKNTFEQDTKNEGRRCGAHKIARLQIKCALTENKQILTI